MQKAFFNLNAIISLVFMAMVVVEVCIVPALLPGVVVMDFILQQSELADLAEKVESGTRLEIEDALACIARRI